MKYIPPLTFIVLSSMILVAGVLAFILFPLPSCPRADIDSRFDCHAHDIESMIAAWSGILLVLLTFASLIDQTTLVRSGKRGVILALVHFFAVLLLGVGAFVALVAAANTFGETRGLHLFYGDAGIGALIIFLLEIAWVLMMIGISVFAFMHAWAKSGRIL